MSNKTNHLRSHSPLDIFTPEGLRRTMDGINNAYLLKHNLGGDPFREDVGRSMVAVTNAEKALGLE